MADVTVRSSASDIRLGQPVVITGRVRGAAEARPRIVLRTESRDYSRAWANVDGRTDRAGRFRFSVHPEINTTFRVAVADGESRQGQSPPVEVRVYPLVAVPTGSGARGCAPSGAAATVCAARGCACA